MQDGLGVYHPPGLMTKWPSVEMAWQWERGVCSCIEENQCWRSQRARLKLSFSSLLHPARISLASERLTHRTLHSQLIEEACPRVSLLSVEGQHMAGHVQVQAGTTWISMVESINGKINTIRVFLGGGVHTHTSFDFHPHLQGILLGSSSQGV